MQAYGRLVGKVDTWVRWVRGQGVTFWLDMQSTIMGIRKFQDLRVWKEAHELAVDIYGLESKDWNIINQTRRAAASVPANIAEGCGRSSTRELIRYLVIARGSLEECNTSYY